jgi:sialate O-acetylesterase
VANVFSQDMVLQQGKPIRIWGRADAGAKVDVALGECRKSGSAGADGTWLVELAPMKAGFDPLNLTVRSGEKTVTYRNVLIGEVWVCGGQSNMAPGGHHNEDVEWPSADYPAVRYTRVEGKVAHEPLADLPARDGWKPMVYGKMEIRRIAPVAYYFGVRLRRFLKVPVGIINTSIGGTTAEVWASRDTLTKHPELKDMIAAGGKDIGAFYNGTILPLARLAVAGVLFYQGENNTFDAYETYAYSFPCVVQDWRRAFGDEKLPFGIISLAGNKAMSRLPEPETETTHRHSYTHIRDVHFRTFRTMRGVGLVPIHDLGEDNMHPGRKRDVGERAARWALAMAYGYGAKPRGKGGVYHTAPIYREMKVDGAKALLYFDYDPIIQDRRAGKWYKRLPLPDRAREYRGFLIAGADHRFFPAQAKVHAVKDDKDIARECLEVWSPDVPRPVAVRYAWANQPSANAYGLCGLPVAPFRTDNWAFIRAQPKWAPDLKQREADNETTRKQSEQWRRDRRIRELKRELQSLGVGIPPADLPARPEPAGTTAPPAKPTPYGLKTQPCRNTALWPGPLSASTRRPDRSAC